MNSKTKAKAKLFAVMFFLGVTHIGAAKAENWQTVGSDQDGLGNDIRTIELDIDSIKATTAELSVKARIISHSIGNEGYNCSEGELRHGNVDKKIAKMICHKESAPNPYGKHESDWQIVRVDRLRNGEQITKFDLNSLSRINDEVWVTQDITGGGKTTFHFDCKGYYKMDGGKWDTLDLTDHIATVPPGFVSLERKTSDQVCSLKGRG